MPINVSMVAAVQGSTPEPCVIKWTGRKGLKVVARTYCDTDVNAADGVLQLPATSKFCAKCTEALRV